MKHSFFKHKNRRILVWFYLNIFHDITILTNQILKNILSENVAIKAENIAFLGKDFEITAEFSNDPDDGKKLEGNPV